MWADGTVLSTGPMTAMQWRIWWLAAAGKFFEGLVVFIAGVAMPLIATEFHISTARGAASLFGILIGAVAVARTSGRIPSTPT